MAEEEEKGGGESAKGDVLLHVLMRAEYRWTGGMCDVKCCGCGCATTDRPNSADGVSRRVE
jgi:hypothetical protein